MSKEVNRYDYGYVDDGNGNRYLGLIEKPDGNLVKHEDYKALLAERDRLREALERFYNANQTRLKLLSRDVYLDMQRLPGMRDALYEMDDAQHQAHAALQGAQP